MLLIIFPVVLICFDTVNLRNFVYRAYDRGMTSPEYAFIFFTYLLEIYEINPWIHDPEEVVSPEEMDRRKSAWMGVKTVMSLLPKQYMWY